MLQGLLIDICDWDQLEDKEKKIILTNFAFGKNHANILTFGNFNSPRL